MMPNGRGMQANLPQEVVNKEYPRMPHPMSGQQPDLYEGVQRQQHYDAKEMKKALHPTK
jgi:hypothetical protein